MSRLTLLCLDIPNSSPGSLRDWSLRIIQGSAQLVPAQRVIHKPWKANHAYDRFLFHRNVRFSSCHCTKGPSSLTRAFPPLSARISFSFLLVHSGKNLTTLDSLDSSASCLGSQLLSPAGQHQLNRIHWEPQPAMSANNPTHQQANTRSWNPCPVTRQPTDQFCKPAGQH